MGGPQIGQKNLGSAFGPPQAGQEGQAGPLEAQPWLGPAPGNPAGPWNLWRAPAAPMAKQPVGMQASPDDWMQNYVARRGLIGDAGALPNRRLL